MLTYKTYLIAGVPTASVVAANSAIKRKNSINLKVDHYGITSSF